MLALVKSAFKSAFRFVKSWISDRWDEIVSISEGKKGSPFKVNKEDGKLKQLFKRPINVISWVVYDILNPIFSLFKSIKKLLSFIEPVLKKA
ncbi:hypothetical protein [Vibrio parahaemolyticus]|uniref:hypothetical protein n=1 Tax=Vibrio parahaemolyticus TaxID=670 RepID=UPI00215C29CD|nr:hypothetical protein [Vibrio parahaemolyticus]MCR9731399.1 hypothetical protein [Vibrio parahaemolyticus]MCR9750398.1 hypothetical protein [Vibrio parahaemolyticus]MCR9786992.1 hypothetical protein [Vibrio parahaemolyticus]MCR9859718.1 hypothetical protein [Vibrio parahaemolyticus]